MVKLVDDIMDRARAVAVELGLGGVSAYCVIIACLDLYNEDYNGALFNHSDSGIRLEEERLRLTVDDVYRVKSGAVMRSIARTTAEKYPTNFLEAYITPARDIASKAEDSGMILRADVLFLLAVMVLDSEDRKGVRDAFLGEIDFVKELNSVNSRVDEYAVNELIKISNELDKKLDETVWYRDNYPAKKLCECDELKDMILSSIKISQTDNATDIILPHFFADENGRLVITVKKSGDSYYFHDNGSTFRFVNKKEPSESDYLGYISHSFGNYIVFLTALIEIANADIYEKHFDEEHGRIGLAGIDDVLCAESTEPVLYNLYIDVDYDKMRGVILHPYFSYINLSTGASFLFSKSNDGEITISDGRYGKYEGEIFELAKWNSDDLSQHSDLINEICDRFGIEFDGDEVCVRYDNVEDTPKCFARFLRGALLLAQVGFTLE